MFDYDRIVAACNISLAAVAVTFQSVPTLSDVLLAYGHFVNMKSTKHRPGTGPTVPVWSNAGVWVRGVLCAMHVACDREEHIQQPKRAPHVPI